MRRSDREIKSPERIREILTKCEVCRIAFSENNQPYIVPMNYGFEESPEGRYTIYLHCAKSGRKLDIISKNNSVCFEIDFSKGITKGESGCDYTMKYESVIGEGVIGLCSEYEEMKHALDLIMNHYAPNSKFEYDPQTFSRTAILKLILNSVSCKSNI